MRSPTLVMPPSVAIEDKDLTQDQQLIMAALINRMRGRGEIETVTFDKKGLHTVEEENFHYEGFETTGVILTGYMLKPEKDGNVRALLQGAFLFKDILNRRAGAEFVVGYIIGKDSLNIIQSAVNIRTPAFPKTEAYFVPGKVKDLFDGGVRNMADLYLYALNHAVPMTYNDESTAKMKFENKNHSILVFSMDRMPGNAKFEVVMTKDPNGSSVIGESDYMVGQGFRVSLAQSKFKPDSPNSKFYIWATYNPDPERGSNDIVIGDFKNKRILRSTLAGQ